jgi:AcrR family transcriptional regulator
MTALPTPQPKQKRAIDTVARLLEATDIAIRTGGEASVRIQDISTQTGVSIGSIYHHFQDRDGLIRATYSHNYARVVETDLPLVKDFLQTVSSRDDMMDRYQEMVDFVLNHYTHQSALDRAAIIGNSAGRPLMQAELSKVQHILNENGADLMRLAAERGMLKEHLNPRAAAMVFLGILFGRAVAELDTEPVSAEDWADAALSAIGGLFKGQSRTPPGRTARV